MVTPVIILVYGLLVATGGVLGFVKARSTISLVTGVLSGALLVFSALSMMRWSYSLGWRIALVIALILLVRFTFVSLNHFKMMPGGLMIGLSLIAVVALALGRHPHV